MYLPGYIMGRGVCIRHPMIPNLITVKSILNFCKLNERVNQLYTGRVRLELLHPFKFS